MDQTGGNFPSKSLHSLRGVRKVSGAVVHCAEQEQVGCGGQGSNGGLSSPESCWGGMDLSPRLPVNRYQERQLHLKSLWTLVSCPV